MGKPGVEDAVLYLESLAAGYSGQLKKARDLTRRAASSALRAEEKETAAGYQIDAALRESLFGNATEAKQRAAAALAVSTNRDVQAAAALAYAFAGDTQRAAMIAADLAKHFPLDTIVQFNYLPEIHGQIVLWKGDGSEAIALLEAASAYELGTPAQTIYLSAYPVYVRGLAYLAAHKGAEAAAEFQKIIDSPGVVTTEPIGALAHVQLARAYAFAGDTAKAKAAYQDFLALWKDADPDIPILKEATSEYAKLQ